MVRVVYNRGCVVESRVLWDAHTRVLRVVQTRVLCVVQNMVLWVVKTRLICVVQPRLPKVVQTRVCLPTRVLCVTQKECNVLKCFSDQGVKYFTAQGVMCW